VPAGQRVQLDLPAMLYFPAGHSPHSVELVDRPNWSTAQAYFPEGQTKHTPALVLNFPKGQSVQSLSPGNIENFPIGHSLHDLDRTKPLLPSS